MKKKRRTKKSIVKSLDKLASTYIRLLAFYYYDGKCFRCLVREVEHCFHFITRARYATRWDEENMIGSCAGCNFAHEFDPAPAIQWYIKKFGQKQWDALYQRSRSTDPWTLDDLLALESEFKTKIEELSYGHCDYCGAVLNDAEPHACPDRFCEDRD